MRSNACRTRLFNFANYAKAAPSDRCFDRSGRSVALNRQCLVRRRKVDIPPGNPGLNIKLWFNRCDTVAAAQIRFELTCCGSHQKHSISRRARPTKFDMQIGRSSADSADRFSHRTSMQTRDVGWRYTASAKNRPKPKAKGLLFVAAAATVEAAMRRTSAAGPLKLCS
jgi:hypothetical protein